MITNVIISIFTYCYYVAGVEALVPTIILMPTGKNFSYVTPTFNATYSTVTIGAEYASSCAIQFSSWTSASLSFSYSNYLASKSFLVTGGVPVSTVNFEPDEPSCCSDLATDWSSKSSSWSESSFSAYLVFMSSFEDPYVLHNVTSTWSVENENYWSCRAGLRSTSTWRSIDGELHGKIFTLPGSCSGEPYTTTVTTSSAGVSPLWTASIEPRYPPACVEKGCGECYIYDRGVEVLYWSVSLSYSDGSTFTITTPRTGINTAEYKGRILTSPTIYLHYKSLWAGGFLQGMGYYYNPENGQRTGSFVSRDDECSSYFKGGMYTDAIIAIPPEVALHSYYYSDSVEEKIIESFDFADLPPNPVPMSKWLRECNNEIFPVTTGDPKEVCATIIDEMYQPRLFQPQAVRDFDPAWENCSFADPGWGLDTIDPPLALMLRPGLTVTSSYPQTTLDPAAPGQGVGEVPTKTRQTVFAPLSAATDLGTPRQNQDSNVAVQGDADEGRADDRVPARVGDRIIASKDDSGGKELGEQGDATINAIGEAYTTTARINDTGLSTHPDGELEPSSFINNGKKDIYNFKILLITIVIAFLSFE